MKKTFMLLCAAVLCFAATGCSSEDSSAPDSSSLSSGTEESDESGFVPTDNIKQIRAVITGYKDGKLSFTFNGKDYTLPMPNTLFEETGFVYPRDTEHEPTLSELVINNRFGCEVKGRITLRDDMSMIVMCDVLSLTVKLYTGSEAGIKIVDGNRTVDPDYQYTFRKTSAHTCEISNPVESLELDLNDLSRILKLRYADSYDKVNFCAAQFGTGDMMLLSCYPIKYSEELKMVVESSDFLKTPPEEPLIGYFGTVKYVADEQAEILLNDGRTTIKVPTYFNDGEVERDMQVLVQTGSFDDYIYGTGGEYSFGEVIVYTAEKLYNKSGYSFDELAYCFIPAEIGFDGPKPYTYVTKAQAENK